MSKRFKTTIGKPFQKSDHVIVACSPRRAVPSRDFCLGRGAILGSGTVLYAGSTIGRGLETGHQAVIREENRIGDYFKIWNNSTVDYGCRIGHRVKVHCNVYIAQYTTIEDDVFIAPGVTITNDLYPHLPESTAHMKGPTIKRGAQIGAHAVILPGVIIGEEALIGAGSVVTKHVPPRSVCWGNPARVHKKLNQLRWKARA